MEYLLIDFGASAIKCCTYDTTTKLFVNYTEYKSPFIDSDSIHKDKLLYLIKNILSKYPSYKKVLCCCILGGQWIDNIYYSWKISKPKIKTNCLISELFIDQSSYHVHKHHGGALDHIIPLGRIDDTLWYSCLGDTNCVIKSIDELDNQYIINIGTGSQVITKETINKYIPAGRSLLVFDKFFQSIGINFFDQLNILTIDQVINSSLYIDLNIFEQAHRYTSGGMISHINEYNFTLTNLLGSILKSLIIQYKPFILEEHTAIRLTGGIPKKIKLIKFLFEYYYQNPIIVSNDNYETHAGLAKFAHLITE